MSEQQDLPPDPPAGTVRVYCRVENYYPAADDEIVTWPVADLPLPPGPMPEPGQDCPEDVDNWINDELVTLTGTGRTKGDAMYDLEVLASSRPDLVPLGYCHEWGY
jgi:hypothetical protein